MYINTAVKGNFPTITNLEDAIKKAGINQQDNRDGRPLQYILQTLCNEPRVRGILNTRKTALTAYDWILEPDLDTTEVSSETKRLSYNITKLIQNHIDLLFGSILYEVKGKINGIGSPVTTELKKITLTEYDKIDDESFVLWTENTQRQIVNIDSTNAKFIYATDSSIELGGIMASIAKHVIYLNELMPKWDSLNKRLQGAIIGTMDGQIMAKNASAIGMKPAEISKLGTDLSDTLKTLFNDGGAALQTLQGIDIKLASIVDASASGSYELYKKTLETDIAIALLGQANTTELPSSGGSRAAIQVLNLIRNDILFSDIINTQYIVNQYLRIEHFLSKGNFEVPYKFKFVLDDVVDTEANARTIQYLSSAGVPIKVKTSELYEKIGFSIPAKEDEDTIDLSSNSVMASNTPFGA